MAHLLDLTRRIRGVLLSTGGHLHGGERMRKSFSQQQRLDCPNIGEVELNLNCRHEIIPILKALQHIYSCPEAVSYTHLTLPTIYSV